MSLASDLNQMDNTLTALLAYANGVTGASDVSVGDAIHTLAQGYGGGGGTPQFESGEFTIASDVAIPTSGYTLPFSFSIDNPDYIIVSLSRASFLEKTSLTNNRVYQVVFSKANIDIPIFVSSSITHDDRVNVDGYTARIRTSASADSASSNGFAVVNTPTFVNMASYPNWRVSNHQVRLARISSAGLTVHAGTFKWTVIKGGATII